MLPRAPAATTTMSALTKVSGASKSSRPSPSSDACTIQRSPSLEIRLTETSVKITAPWFTASGRAKLYSYVINHRAPPHFQDWAPYVIAVVELEEGPRMMTNVVGVEAAPEHLPIDLPLRVTWQRENDTITLPLFEPAGSAP